MKLVEGNGTIPKIIYDLINRNFGKMVNYERKKLALYLQKEKNPQNYQ